MNWQRIGRLGWHGFAAATIAFGTSVGVLQAWPNKLQWLILISGCGMAFVKGVNGFQADPEGKQP